MARRGAKLGTSVLDLDIDDSKFHSKLSGAYKAAQGFTDKTGKSFINAGKSMSNVGSSMTRNVTLPIIAAGGAVAKMGLDFDTSLRQVVGLTDVTQEQIGGIREELLKLAPEVGRGPQELAEAFYFVASAGFEADEAMEVLRTSAKAAATGLGETQDVAKVLGSVINAYGKENITAARAADILVEAISKGTAEAPEFASVIGRVTPTAASLGVTFDQVASALAGMTLTGLSAEESATSLNQVLISLLKPTSEAEGALRDMGLSSAELRRQLREEGLLATLRTLEERFAGNEQASSLVFGNVRALRGVTSLLTLDTEQLNDIFGDVNDSLGRLQQGYEDTEGPQRELDRNMADLQVTAIQLGTDVLPLVVEIMGEIAVMARGLSAWWKTLDNDTKQLIIRGLAFIAVIGPMLVVVGKLTTGLGHLIKAVAFLGSAKGFPAAIRHGIGFARFMIGPGGLVVAAGLAVLAIDKLIDDALSPLSDEMKALADSTGEDTIKVEKHIGRLADELGISFDAAERRVREYMEATGRSFDDAVDAVERGNKAMTDAQWDAVEESGIAWEAYQKQILGYAADTADGAAAAIEALPPEVVAALEAAGIPIGAAADGAMGPIDDAAKAARDAALAHMKAMLGGIAGMFDSDESVREAFQGLLDRMDDPYTEAERKADIFSQDMITVIKTALDSDDPGAVGATTEFVNRMLGEFALMEPGALESGDAVPPAIREGMDREMEALIDWIEENVTGESLAAMEIDAVPQGLEAIASYARGMDANERAASTAASRVGRAALTSLQNEIGWTQAGRNIVDLIANGVDESVWRLQSAMRGTAQAARIVLPDSEPKDPKSPFRGLGHTGEAIVDLIAGGIDRRTPKGAEAMRRLAESMRLDWAGIDAMAIPDIRAPAIASTPGLGAAGVAGLGATVQVTEYHLHYNGRDQGPFGRDDFMRELEGISRFDEGAVGG
jgi:TP901 family phage tail tape measure protein